MGRADDTRWVVGEALRLGFGLAGVSRVRPSRYADQVRAWLQQGMHGEMGYLAEHAELRLDPARFVPGAVSVICVADAYAAEVPEASHAPKRARIQGQIARYAWGADYHKVLKKRLHRMADLLRERWPNEVFRSTADTAPILEREHAAQAGLGFVGKNTMLIHPRHGSYTLLGCIVTSVDLAPSLETDLPGVEPRDRCGGCTRCIDACPTDAIAADGYQLDARRCISYLTLEHRSPIDPSLQVNMGNWVAGCDICQEVCPFNEAGKRRPLPIVLKYRPRLTGLNLEEAIDWTAEDRTEAFQGSALKRMKLEMVRRNALIALVNACGGNPPERWRSRIKQIAREDEAELVRETAQQIVSSW